MTSRNEQLLEAMLNGETVDFTPQSRNEALMQQIIKNGGGSGGGGGGVSWNDLKDKPFGDADTVILEEQELQYDAEADGCVGTPTHPIHDGDALTIVYDGKSYECNAVFDASYNSVDFGNFSIVGHPTDTGEPFFGSYIDGIVLIMPRDKASHTVKITAVVTTKIPTRYLPDSIGGVQYVTIGMDEYDNYTASATYDQISEWIRAGKDVKCILGTLVLSLGYSDALADVSTYLMLYRHEFFCVVDTVYYAVTIDYANEVAYTQVALPVDK